MSINQAVSLHMDRVKCLHVSVSLLLICLSVCVCVCVSVRLSLSQLLGGSLCEPLRRLCWVRGSMWLHVCFCK